MIHPDIQQIITQFEANELHAARSGRKVMDALASVITDFPALDFNGLASELDSNVDALLRVMPAYAPPINVMNQIYSYFESIKDIQQSVEEVQAGMADVADAYRKWSQEARLRIAMYGGSVIPQGGTVFTYTLSETALRTIREAWNHGVEFKLLVTESRPNNDGLITAKALADEGVDVEIGVDANMGELVSRADVMIVGAEAVLTDGSAICKVGTYPAALVAKEYSVPVYVLVDSLKFHSTSLFGQKLWLDPIQREVFNEDGITPRAAVSGHLFDRTPPELISAIVTERGFMHPEQVSTWMLGMPTSESILTRLGYRGANPIPQGE